MKKLSLFIMALVCVVSSLHAKVELPSIFADGMVLQQNTDVAFWGKAKPGSKVKISASWKEKVSTTASDEGKWMVTLPTPAACAYNAYSVTVDDGDGKVVLDNVLIGEVWLCSGQSNMEMPMKGFYGQPVVGAMDYVIDADPLVPIRICNIAHEAAFEPKDDCKATWYEHTPEGVSESSAVAYFFALRLYKALRIPVAVINTSWESTAIQAWMNRELLDSEFAGEFDMTHFQTRELKGKRYPYNKPGVLYNAMIHPLAPYTIKGFTWYQGCGNMSKPEQYKRLQPAFVKMLRELWGNDELPFYFTQIAPFHHKDPQGRKAPYMMWAQAQTLEMIPHSGMVSTHDIGEYDCIHPADKKPVGDRLAYHALVNDYGFTMVDCNPPVPVEFEFKDGKAIVTFKVGKWGLSPYNTTIEGFELAGEDKVFHPATARIKSDLKRIEVTSPEVSAPVAVRYGMRNWSVATLFNCHEIPASPFRSDDWE